MDNLAPKQCLQCGKPLTGRIDKKFCDAYCRNAYNNQRKSADEHLMMQVNAILRKNRRILKTLSPEGKATIRKEILDHMGYDFHVFSGVYRTQSMTYYKVYDYAFAPIFQNEVKKVLIVKKQSYMNKLGFEIWRK